MTVSMLRRGGTDPANPISQRGRDFVIGKPVLIGARRLLVLLLLSIPLLARGAEPTKGKQRVLLFAAASTSTAMDEIRSQFIQGKDIEVLTNYAASSTLAQQIVQGAEADLFVSADARWADYLAQKGLVAQRHTLLGNRLVVVVSAEAKLRLEKLEDLGTAGIEHLALGEPGSVPAGRYAKQALTKLGLWNRLKDKVVPAEDVRHALALVETGSAEVGIVYATDAAISKRVRVVLEIPQELTEPIQYPVVLLKHGESNAAAQSFYRYLESPEAVAVFQKYGFTVLDAQEKTPGAR